MSISSLDIESVRTVNVDGTRNVVEAARRAGVRRLVYTSSVHALTEPGKGGVLTEEAGYDPDRAPGDYGKAKAAASRIVLDAVQEGLDAVLVNPSLRHPIQQVRVARPCLGKVARHASSRAECRDR